VEYIKENAGIIFDPKIVEIFFTMMEQEEQTD